MPSQLRPHIRIRVRASYVESPGFQNGVIQLNLLGLLLLLKMLGDVAGCWGRLRKVREGWGRLGNVWECVERLGKVGEC